MLILKNTILKLMFRLTFYLSILFTFQSFAQKEVIIRGKISGPEDNKIHIRNIKHYKDYLNISKIYYASTDLSDNGTFEMKFEVERSMPVQIDYGDASMEMFVFPGAILDVTANGKNFAGSLSYKGTGEEFNNFLVKYYDKFESPKEVEKLRQNIQTMTTGDFMNFNNKRKSSQTDMLNSVFKGNISSTFKTYMEINIQYDWAKNFLEYFNYALQKNIPIDTSRYSFLKEIQIENTKAFSSTKYLEFLKSYSGNLYYKDCAEKIRIGEEIDTNKYYYEQYKIRLVYFSDDKIKELLLAKAIADAIDNPNLPKVSHDVDKMLRNYSTVTNNQNFFKVLLKKYRTLNALAPGNPAPDFTYKDKNGQEVSLSSFKGKVVYVDVWASWCGICRKEIPHTKKLEEKFRNENVAIVYVSIDRVEKMWRKIIDENGLGGTNLLTEEHFDSKIVQDYNIQSVPHYILIDQNGTVVENRTKNASEGIERDIQALLGKK